MTEPTDPAMSAATTPGPAGRTSRRLRWGLPVAAVVTVAAAVAVPGAMAAGDPKGLAPRTAGALLTDLADAKATPVSGTVVQTARLGLPKLPAGTTGTDPTALVSGSHTLRVWTDGKERSRLALLGQLAEYDVVRDGRNVWTYRSEKNEAVHYTLPAGTAESGARTPGQPTPESPMTLPATPQQAADQVLAALTPTTDVTVGDAVKVAGRKAYTLVLAPRDTSSLVGSVRLAVDSATSVPLRVQVFGSSDSQVPALEVGFTDVSFTAPAASAFTFRAPQGAKVTEQTVPAPGEDAKAGDTAGDRVRGQDAAPDAVPGAAAAPDNLKAPGEQAGAPEVRGTGWTSIVVLKGVDTSGLSQADPRMLDALTVRVAEGRLLATKLVTVLLTDDGRVLAGAVTPEVLRAAAR